MNFFYKSKNLKRSLFIKNKIRKTNIKVINNTNENINLIFYFDNFDSFGQFKICTYSDENIQALLKLKYLEVKCRSKFLNLIKKHFKLESI